MKKIAKALLSLVLLVGLFGVFGATTTSCSSSEKMYTSKKTRSKVINRNYRMRGTNSRNSSTYRTY